MTSVIYQFLANLNESEGVTGFVSLLHNQPHGVASVLADNKKHNMPTRKVTKPSQITFRTGKFFFQRKFLVHSFQHLSPETVPTETATVA